MPDTISSRRSPVTRPAGDTIPTSAENGSASPWLSVVTDKLKGMRYGVIQIVVHDAKVVQIERTERTRFEIPPSVGGF